jgi:putative addiction module killer protein
MLFRVTYMSHGTRATTSLEAIPRTILICQTDDGKEPFTDWFFSKLDAATRGRVRAKLDRLEDGNVSDVKAVGEGVLELKIDFGPGYRVYFGQKGREVHLMNAGVKDTQSTDIAYAKAFWRKHE